MQRIALAFILTTFALIAAACGSSTAGGTGKVIKSAPIGNNLTVALSNKDGAITHGDAEFFLTFKDATGKAVEMSAVALNFYMPPMGTMGAMNDGATITKTDTPGVYQVKVNLEASGDWQAQLSYEGSAARGKGTFPVTVQ